MIIIILRVYTNLLPWIWNVEEYKSTVTGTLSDMNKVLIQARQDILAKAPKSKQHYKDLEDALNKLLNDEKLRTYLSKKMGEEVTGKYLGQDIGQIEANNAINNFISVKNDVNNIINNLNPDTVSVDQVEMSKGKMSNALGKAFEYTLAYYGASLEEDQTEEELDNLVEELMSGSKVKSTLQVSMTKIKTKATKKNPIPVTIMKLTSKKIKSLQKTDISIACPKEQLTFNISAKNYTNLNNIKIIDESPLLNMIDMWNSRSAIYKYLHSSRFGDSYHNTALKIMGTQALAGGIKKEGEKKLVNALAMKKQNKIHIISIQDILFKIGNSLPLTSNFAGITKVENITMEKYTKYLQDTKVTMHLKNLMSSISSSNLTN